MRTERTSVGREVGSMEISIRLPSFFTLTLNFFAAGSHLTEAPRQTRRRRSRGSRSTT